MYVAGFAGRRVAQRLLIDADHFVDLLDAANFVVRPGQFAGAMQRARQRVVEHIFDERAFAAAADAGDGGERAQRNSDVDVAEIVVPGTEDFQTIRTPTSSRPGL